MCKLCLYLCDGNGHVCICFMCFIIVRYSNIVFLHMVTQMMMMMGLPSP